MRRMPVIIRAGCYARVSWYGANPWSEQFRRASTVNLSCRERGSVIVVNYSCDDLRALFRALFREVTMSLTGQQTRSGSGSAPAARGQQANSRPATPKGTGQMTIPAGRTWW